MRRFLLLLLAHAASAAPAAATETKGQGRSLITLHQVILERPRLAHAHVRPHPPHTGARLAPQTRLGADHEASA